LRKLVNSKMLVPIEVLSDNQAHQLEAAQDDLAEFRLTSSPTVLAKHIHNTAIFSQALAGRVYPILEPSENYGIYQTWA
jgi:hypothetical protein